MSPTDYLASGGGTGNTGGFVALLTPKMDRPHLERIQVCIRSRPLRAGQNLESQFKLDHRRCELVQYLLVSFNLPLGR